MRLIEDCNAFCCSFQDQPTEAAETEEDSRGGEPASVHGDQDATMQAQNEVSAFAMDEEMKEEEKSATGGAMKVEELDQERTATLALRKELTEKYQPLAIDMKAVKDFFQKLKGSGISEQAFWESIEIMVDLILHEFEASNCDDFV